MTDDPAQWSGPMQPLAADQLADHQALTALCRTYALGVDMRDEELCLSVFDPVGTGRGTVGEFPLHEYISRSWRGAVDNYERTQHCIHNQYVALDGDEATVWSYCVAYHTVAAETGSGDMLTVGVQYRDRCHRTDRGWLIREREAVMQWRQGELPDLSTGEETP